LQVNPITTDIKTNIVNYLFVGVPCPKCGTQGAASLGAMHRKEKVTCSNCGQRMTFFLDAKRLDDFASAFNQLYEQLNKIGLPLAFFHNPMATIWSSK